MGEANGPVFYQYNYYKSNQIFPDNNNIYLKPNTNGKQVFEVIWKELTLKVKKNLFHKKIILNNVSGSFKSGQIFAILGPSGCGKSTLLGCLFGNIKNGLSGSITISTQRKVKFAFIAQNDYLEEKLTIKESLLYASKLKNELPIDHKLNVETVLKKLNIENCANIRPKRCSGGQKKRISIALELVSKPNILILDEPTSGLDSVTTWQLINTLIELTTQAEPLAVVATIHQPSGKLFNLFNSVYIMSYDGQCIYHGSPLTMINFLAQYGLKCPNFHNPSDYVLEVASREHGVGKVMLLSSIMKIEALDLMPHRNTINPYLQYNTFSDVCVLSIRTFFQTIRDLFMLPIRLAVTITFAINISLFWGSESGKIAGCPNDFISDEISYSENYARVSAKMTENFACIIFIIMNVWFTAIFSVLLTFPKTMNTFIKEYRNGWYSCFSYYMSVVLVDIIFQVTIPNILSIPVYILTGQYYEGEEWRLVYFTIICIVVALTSTSLGLMVSAMLMEYPTAAAFIGCILGFPLFLFSGFMIPIKDMPEVFQYITYGNFVRFALSSATAAVYGFDRCKGQTVVQNTTSWLSLIDESMIEMFDTKNQIDGKALMTVIDFFSGSTAKDSEPILMTQLGYEDNDLYKGLAILILLMFIFKFVTYYVILRKVKTIS